MLLIGHRGASGYEPENTISSFQKAIHMRCDGIELDVQLTKDKELVVIHDSTLERTTSGWGDVAEKGLEELRLLDAGNWFGGHFRGQTVPSLEDVFFMLSADLVINIEIKCESDSSWTIEKKLLELIYAYGFSKNVLISSFHHKVLKHIRMLDEEVRLGVLINEPLDDIFTYLEKSGLNAYSIHPTVEIVDKEFVNKLKKLGYLIFPYTVNDHDQANKLMELGVDGIITDYLDILDSEESA